MLADNCETYLYQALQFYEWGFLLKPGVIIIAVITTASIWLGARNRPHNPVADKDGEQSHSTHRRPQVVFSAAVFLFFVLALLDSLRHSFLGGVFTGGVSTVMLPISGVVIWKLVMGKGEDPVNSLSRSLSPATSLGVTTRQDLIRLPVYKLTIKLYNC